MKRILFGVGRGLQWSGRMLGAAGRATIALVGICGVVAALANYTMTQGAGTTFGSIVVSTVHYAQMLICDPATPSQCGAVNAAGSQQVDWTSGSQAHTDMTSAVPVGDNGIGRTKNWDGTNVQAVKAASTAPVAADPAAVTTLSPNTGEVGVPGTGISQPTGGIGLSGWLSGIYNSLIGGTNYGNAANFVRGTTAAMTGTTSTQLIAAVVSKKIYLTDLTCGNSHATVGTFVNIQDGSGGTTMWTVPAATVYGGATLRFATPLPTTSGNGVFAVDATTGANVICSGSGFSAN